jgi:hypothetical protein
LIKGNIILKTDSTNVNVTVAVVPLESVKDGDRHTLLLPIVCDTISSQKTFTLTSGRIYNKHNTQYTVTVTHDSDIPLVFDYQRSWIELTIID